uniref:DUF4637 domain-containing protein n=1 Tax=Zonotrichia albicollis TaxID=44394 RepID=A0A8D2N7S1_ZONAL
GAAGMTDKMTWHKGKKELTEESAGEGKHGRKKREVSRVYPLEGLINRIISELMNPSVARIHARAECHLCVCPRSPQGRSPLAEDTRRCWHRRGCRRPQEEPCPLPQLGAPRRSGRMCPSCEILLCRPCGTLHSQRAFIAHSLLDHYDSAALPCSAGPESIPNPSG